MADGLKLNALLPDRLDALGERARQELCKNDDIGAMKLAWDYIGTQLTGALAQALDCDLLEMLAEGWAKAEVLADFAKHPAGDHSVVELMGHDVTKEFKPVIAVTIGSCPCAELEFTFALTAHFGGVQLTISNGHITEGRTGEAWASAQLSYEGIPLHGAAETRKLPIPGTFQFKPPGVPIPAAAA